MTDQQLQAGLQAFVDNAVTPSSGGVTVDVRGGVVTLSGQVASTAQRTALRDIVGAADGVQHVIYAVEVRPAGRVLA